MLQKHQCANQQNDNQYCCTNHGITHNTDFTPQFIQSCTGTNYPVPFLKIISSDHFFTGKRIAPILIQPAVTDNSFFLCDNILDKFLSVGALHIKKTFTFQSRVHLGNPLLITLTGIDCKDIAALGDFYGFNIILERPEVFRKIQTNEQDRNNLSGCIFNRQIFGYVILAEKMRLANKGFSLNQPLVGGMIPVQYSTIGPAAILLFQGGTDPDKIISAPNKNRTDRLGHLRKSIHYFGITI